MMLFRNYCTIVLLLLFALVDLSQSELKAPKLNLQDVVGGGNQQQQDHPKFPQKINEADLQNLHDQQPGLPVLNRQQPPLQPGQGRLLADSVACSNEVARYCSNVIRTNDILMLQCLQDAGDDVLSEGCQQELWNMKLNLTQDDRFRQAALQYCAAELQTYPCAQPLKNAEQGHLVLCLVEYKANMTNKACQNFINRIESIMFTDFSLVGRFARACQADIQRLSCGQGHFAPSVKQQIQQKTKVIHSQGGTLECLMQKMIEQSHNDAGLAPECRHEVLRLAEMQADDFNLDRPLFFACRDDRERYCRDVQMGNGRVFACLVENLSHRQMAFECREAVVLRMRMMQRDYKLSHALVQQCQTAITENQCAPKGLEEQSDHFFLTYLLLCLENAMKQNKQIPTNCQNQMFEHRRLILTEGQMEPETVIACSHDIELHCRQLNAGGETLHCLMGVAKRPAASEYAGLSTQCFQALSKLIKAADVGSNYQVDQVLYRDCKNIIENVCKKEAATETDVLSCLMNNIESAHMTDQCEERLLEIQYFLARDFSLDPQLYNACKVDAEQKCHYKDDWSQPSSRGKNAAGQQGPDPGYLVLTCLYRHAYEDDGNAQNALSETCAVEVRRVLRERAVSVHLLPSIEEACRGDLAEHCSQKTKPGAEWTCLQDKFELLTAKCKNEVKNFTAMQSKDSRLDRVLNRACKPVIDQYCEDVAGQDLDNGDVIECLMRNKAMPEMTKKCRVYINHVELMTMQDYQLSFKFNQACQRDIKLNCLTSGKHDKVSIIRCLSEILVHRTLLNEGPEISNECRRQMKVEYFKLDTVSLANWRKIDPKFVDVCKADLSSYRCDEEDSVEKAIECLKDRKSDLNSACKKYIFERERLEFADNTFDVALNRICSHEIRQFCQNEEKQHVLHCLVEHKPDPQMSADCLSLVEKRQREQASDVRLQPVLYKHCLPDINQFCKAGFEKLKLQEKQHNEEELQAIILTCLRGALVEGKHLSSRCQHEVKQLIYESELDPQLDPPFYAQCKSDIKRYCSESLLSGHGHDGIMECMKVKYRDHVITNAGCIKEIERKIRELLFDVHLDESLYEACQLDIKRYCNDILPGNGNQLKCLLMASQSNMVTMSNVCKSKLTDRALLWKSTNEDFAHIEGLQDVGALINISPSKNYLLTVLLVIVLLIFGFGLCFGRLTKRVRRELKNR